ncbi:MAG: DUF4147 domain-containing protein [Myxococcales bacterium]|nr:DUF4147 domain-containing protein [Myxococcales bacterium]
MSQRVTGCEMAQGIPERLVGVARAAIAACGGDALTEAALRGRTGSPWIVGVGKASGAMAEGARRALGARFRCGPLIGKEIGQEIGQDAGPAQIPVLRAGHPLPDERGVAATHALCDFLAALGPDEEVVLLLSGGASALLAATVEGVSLAGLRAATLTLLRGGATIRELNAIRRHVGRALGGRLALGTAAQIEVLALSDVVGDDAAAIGSGPASPDPSTFVEALAVAERYGVAGDVRAELERGARGERAETPKPGDPRLARVRYRILATPATLLGCAAEAVRQDGLIARVDPAPVEGALEEVAARYAARARGLARGTVLLAVGEPTVRVRGHGQGGRSQQLALAMAERLAGSDAAFLAIGSDGSDGPTDAAGAVVDGGTWETARALGLDPAGALEGCDAYPVLDAVGALIRTGETGTNLLDLHLLTAP